MEPGEIEEMVSISEGNQGWELYTGISILFGSMRIEHLKEQRND